MRLTYIFVIILTILGCSQRGVVFKQKEYFSRKEIRDTHRSIAILPFNYAMNKKSRGVFEKVLDGKDDLEQEQKTVGENLQNLVYKEFLKSKMSITIQSITETNKILIENNILYKDLRKTSKAELARLLNVDAIVYADIFINTALQPDNPIFDNIDSQQTEFTVEIYGQVENDIVWKAQSIFPRLLFYDEVAFKEIIRQSLIPSLPYYSGK